MKSKHLVRSINILAFLLVLITADTVFARQTDVYGKWEILRDPNTNQPIRSNGLNGLRPGFTATVLPNGKVFIFHNGRDCRIFDPSTNLLCQVAPSNEYRDCSMPVLFWTERGIVYSIGGRDENWNLLSSVESYNLQEDYWNGPFPMEVPRWYPSVTGLPNGTYLIMAGMTGRTIEDSIYASSEIFNPVDQTCEMAANMLTAGVFPSSVLAMDGRVFAELRGVFQVYDPDLKEWNLAGCQLENKKASLIVFEDGNIAIIGGKKENQALNSCIIYNPDTGECSLMDNLNYARYSAHTLWLPTGELFVGGGEDRRKRLSSCEMFNSIARRWSKLARLPRPIGHHGAFVLLHTAEILAINERGLVMKYTPPYLFKGERPIILNDFVVKRGQDFTVEVESKGPIGGVSIIGMSSVTHHVNSGPNRCLFPKFDILSEEPTEGVQKYELLVKNKYSPEILPPGYYFVFVLDEGGVPSVAKIVNVSL